MKFHRGNQPATRPQQPSNQTTYIQDDEGHKHKIFYRECTMADLVSDPKQTDQDAAAAA